MAVTNNWILHNLDQRLSDFSLDLKVTLQPYSFKEMSFHAAADYTANLINENYNNLFLSHSGGADSDYVFHCLCRNNIKFTPIIVETSGNSIELKYALHSCKKFNITPVILKLSNKEYLEIFKSEIIDKLNGVGIYTVPGIVAGYYAKDHDGILIKGDHFIENDQTSIYTGINEWDFYNEVLIGYEYNIPFFNYTIELSYAMVNEIKQMHISDWKKKTYNLDYRPKIDYNFSYHFQEVVKKFFKLRPYRPEPTMLFGAKEQFLKILKP